MKKGFILLGLASVTGIVGATIYILNKRKKVNNMNIKRDPVEVIGKEEYRSDKFYKKRILKYYILDDVLYDTYTRKIITDGNYILGKDWQNDHRMVFRMQAGDPYSDEHLYIRNHNKKIDFCVLDIKGGYATFTNALSADELDKKLRDIARSAVNELFGEYMED